MKHRRIIRQITTFALVLKAVVIIKFAAEFVQNSALLKQRCSYQKKGYCVIYVTSMMLVVWQSTQLLPGYVLFNYGTLSDPVISADYAYSVDSRDIWRIIHSEIC